MFVYSILFGVGNCIFKQYALGCVLLFFVAPVAALWIWFAFNDTRKEVVEWLMVLTKKKQAEVRPKVAFQASKRGSLL